MLTMVPFAGHAEVPQQINYQGKLTDPDGNPLNGNFVMIFHLHDVPELGKPLWSDEHAVDVIGGIYNVQLGSVSANPFPEGLFENEELYLEVVILDPDTQRDETLFPSQRLTSTAFAMKAEDAETLDGFDSTDFLSATSPNEISGSSPDAMLSVTNIGDGDALWGFATGSSNNGVYGYATGNAGHGVHGLSSADNGRGIYGEAHGTGGVGVYGKSPHNIGVFGESTAADHSGVHGQNTDGVGIRGHSDNNHGVVGWTDHSDKSGVFGNTRVGTGVTGRTEAASGRGVYGEAVGSSGVGVYGLGGKWAGYFSGDMYTSGKVGIGTTSPAAKLHVYETLLVRGADAGLAIVPDTDSVNLVYSKPYGAYVNMCLYWGKISFNGKVGIDVVPDNILTVVQHSATDPIADAWTTYSSGRWKTNISPIEGALEKVQRLSGVSFDWKIDGKHDIGLIAEDVGEVIPEVVAYEENGKDAKSLDYARLVAVLIEAMKEQQKEIEELKAAVMLLTSE